MSSAYQANNAPQVSPVTQTASSTLAEVPMLAEEWRRALSFFTSVVQNKATTRAFFETQTATLFDLLTTQELDFSVAEARGAELARAGYLKRDVLIRSQKFIFERIAPIFTGTPEQSALVFQQLSTFWTHYTVGYLDAQRDILLSQQEQIRRSLQENLARRSEAQRRRAEQTETVLKVIRATTTRSDWTLSEILQDLCDGLHLAGAALYEIEKQAEVGYLVAEQNMPMLAQTWRRLEHDAENLLVKVWQGGDAVRASELPSFPLPDCQNDQEAFVVPLRTQSGIVGILALLLQVGHEIDDDLMLSFQLVSQQVAHAIESRTLLHTSQAQLHELQAIYGQQIRENWRIFDQSGYLADGSSLVELLDVPTEDAGLHLPLMVRGESIGAISVDPGDGILEEDDLLLVQIVADQMAQALEAARLFQQTRRQSSQLRAAAEVGRAASSLLSLDELLNTTVNLVRRTFGYYHAQVFLVDEHGAYAELKASTGEIGELLLARGHKLAVGSQSVIGRVTTSGEPVVARDTDHVHRRNELLPNTRAELAVPLRYGSRIIGALDVQSTEPNVFSPDDIAVLSALADQLAIAIENARAYEFQRQTAERLREVDRVKTQFLANMSHELRTPLNSIIGFSRVILKGIDGPITELQQKDLTTIYNAGQHLLGLIDDILDISKIEAGKMEMDFDWAELRQIVDSVMSTAQGLVKGRPVQLRRELPPELPKIRADATRIRQVLLNLFSNASKFTEQGEILCTVTQIGDMIQISVSDTGLGIPPDKIPNLFQVFYQVDSSATRKVGGSGLGLAISRYFVEMHGGEIWAESSGIPGEGTSFIFTLPVNGPPEKLATSDEPAPVVLAVDSEAAVTGMYTKYLEPQGYRVISIHDGTKVLEAAIEHRPVTILLDTRLPGRDGWQVLSDLKGHIVTRDIPVVVCSVETDTGRGRQAGANDYLIKPILRNDLLGAITRLTNTQPAR